MNFKGHTNQEIPDMYSVIYEKRAGGGKMKGKSVFLLEYTSKQELKLKTKNS